MYGHVSFPQGFMNDSMFEKCTEKSTFMAMLGVIVANKGTDSEAAFSACFFHHTIMYHKAGALMKEKFDK